METQRRSKIFDFAKVIGTVHGLSPQSGPLISRVVPEVSPSVTDEVDSDNSSGEKTPPKIGKYKWKGKTTTI